MKSDYNQGIKARRSVSKVIKTKCYFIFLKTAWIPNHTDCQETSAVAKCHGATPQWHHSKWLTASGPAPLDYSMFRVPLVYGKHFVGQSLQKSALLTLNFMLRENEQCVECMNTGLCFRLKHRDISATAYWIYCSIVGATVTVHQFFCILHYTSETFFRNLTRSVMLACLSCIIVCEEQTCPIKCVKQESTPLFFHLSHAYM